MTECRILPAADGEKYDWLFFTCGLDPQRECAVRCGREKQHVDKVGCVWQWDGNVEKPSVVPSVRCDRKGCGVHFTLIKGKAVEA